MRRTLDKDKTCRTIKDICRKKHISAITLAELLNVTEQTVYSWFSAKKLPSIDHLIEIADILEVTLDDLIKTHMFMAANAPPTYVNSEMNEP